MPIGNTQIAERLDHLADLLEIQGANPFRVRAYRNAARTVQALWRPVADLVAEGEDLDELPSVGADLAQKIALLAETGELPMIRDLEAQLPGELGEMLSIPGLGPRRVQRLFGALGVTTLAELEEAARGDRIAALKGFGETIQQRVLDALDERRARGQVRRVPWEVADPIARALVAWLQAAPGVVRTEVAGSYRRRRDTVGDLDVLVAAAEPGPVAERFVGWDRVERVTAHGGTRSAVQLYDGLQVDLRIVPAESWGAALHYFTGSKPHNIAVRKRGLARGLKLNEYGVFRGDDRAERDERVGGATEEEVFAAVDLPWIPPELREDRGEIEAAEQGRLPVLVEAGELGGDLHLVADADPTALIEAARERGWAWVGLAGAVERGRPVGLRVLSVAEVDLGRGPEVEPAADVVIARATGPESPTRRTERLVQAIGAGRVQVVVLGDCAIEPIARAARAAGCALEVAPDGPEETAIRAAVEAGVRLALTSRARTPAELDRIGLSLARARRGWASAADVIDTRWLPAPRRRA